MTQPPAAPNSWDCFDTLVARRRFTPISVFDELAEILDLPDFTKRRRAAESRAPETLDSICDELAKDYGWSETEKDHFRDQEAEAEPRSCWHQPPTTHWSGLTHRHWAASMTTKPQGM